MLQDLALGPDTVDVSMETLASVWTHDNRGHDLSDLGEKRHAPSTVWESQCVLNSSPAGLMWTEQLSPHLQRNKQLQDTLLQREEELARLQEENNKLREFLSSSFVKNLMEKAQKLTAEGKRKLKRNLMYVDVGPFQNCGNQPVASQQVRKRVCRNLTAELCSESSETSASSEPNLDLWVLRTLGLKDRDTIDTSSDSLSSPGYSLRSLVHNATFSTSGDALSSFSPTTTTSTPTSTHSYCQSSTNQSEYGYSAAKGQEANYGYCTKSAQNCTTPPGQCSDFNASTLTGQYESGCDVIRSYYTLTAFQSPPITGESPFTQSPDRGEICSITALSRAQTLEGNPAEDPAYWSSLRDSRTPSQDTIQFSPSGERVHLSPVSSLSPVTNQPWMPVQGCSPKSPSAASQPPATPQTPRSRTDLAFSMSLSPSSSVKTHSFPQGQAFVRKDTEGRWNFTWVPRQGP